LSSPLFLELRPPGCTVHVVIDSVVAGRSSGGVRIVPGIARSEVADLAREMTLKYALFRLPRGGAKTGIDLAPDLSAEERLRALEAVGRGLSPILWAGLYNPGMDMNCGPAELQAIYRGAGIAIGTPTDTSFFTALTVAACVEAAAEDLGRDRPVTLAVEGFGSVGRHLASVLPAGRFRITAVSTLEGAVRKEGGFDLASLVTAKETHGDALVHHLGGEPIGREALFLEDVDILLPSSRTRVLTESLARGMRTRAVVPIANAPYDEGSLAALEERGVLCLPGYLVNSGGVFASSLYDSGVPRGEVERLFATRYRSTVGRLLARSRELGVSVVHASERIARNEADRRGQASPSASVGEKVARRILPRLPRRWRAVRARTQCLRSLDALDADIAALDPS
jgi:glutamate dehydrogenase/leucine dehydrogenase